VLNRQELVYCPVLRRNCRNDDETATGGRGSFAEIDQSSVFGGGDQFFGPGRSTFDRDHNQLSAHEAGLRYKGQSLRVDRDSLFNSSSASLAEIQPALRLYNLALEAALGTNYKNEIDDMEDAAELHDFDHMAPEEVTQEIAEDLLGRAAGTPYGLYHSPEE
jgi:hypothetical protein